MYNQFNQNNRDNYYPFNLGNQNNANNYYNNNSFDNYNNSFDNYNNSFGNTFQDLEGNTVYVIQPEKKKFIPMITLLIIITNVIAFFLCIGVDNYFQVGGVNYEYVTKNKEYGRLISYMFLHADLKHIAGNMVALWIFGYCLEGQLGSLRTAIIYFGSGVGAAIVSMNMYHILDSGRMHFAAGASGAVFGMMCATALLMVKGEGKISGKDVGVAILIVVVYALFTMGGNVDIYGHIGGAVTGGLLAFVLHLKRGENYKENTFLRFLAAILTLWCCIMGIGEARIGRENDKLPDENVEFVLNQPISYYSDVTFKEGFESYCNDCEWESFVSTEGDTVVEFHGNCTYNGSYTDIMMQVVVDERRNNCAIHYIELGGTPLNSHEIGQFIDELVGIQRRSSRFFELRGRS